MPIRVAINGFGRIGRLVLRSIAEHGRTDIEVVAINDLGPVATNAHLLKYDSTHRRFPGEVTHGEDWMDVGFGRMRATAIRNPAELPHKDLGVDIAFECTGIFTARDKASAHLEAGAKRVLISAPGDKADKTIVMGVNDHELTADDVVVSNGSCTTNALAPVAKVLMELCGIERGYMTTIHSYTNDQPSLDQMHKDLYRARTAAQNIIPTSTGAAKALGLVLPALKGKLDGALGAGADPRRQRDRLQGRALARRDPRRDQRGHEGRGRLRPAEGNPRRHRRAAGVQRLHPRPPLLHLRPAGDPGGRGQAGAGVLLVRQRVGLLDPDGRHGDGDGKVPVAMAEATETAPPKRHSAFAQVVFRKLGESLDLGGKTIVGLGGAGPLFKAHGFVDMDWPRLLTWLVVGGAIVALGIYLQAKAEET